MAIVRTRNDLVNQALANLGLLAAGQNAAPEDFALVNPIVDELAAWLEATDIISVDNIDEIPLEWFGPMAALLGDAAAFSFGLPGIPASPGVPDPVQGAIDALRLVTYGRPTYVPLKTQYF